MIINREDLDPRVREGLDWLYLISAQQLGIIRSSGEADPVLEDLVAVIVEDLENLGYSLESMYVGGIPTFWVKKTDLPAEIPPDAPIDVAPRLRYPN